MSSFVFDALSSVSALLFKSTDQLHLDSTFENSSISLTSSGLTTTLGVNGVQLTFPSAALAQASGAGNVTFSDGTHLFIGQMGGDPQSGTAVNDAMFGSDGNDQMSGAGGHDYMMGGSGADNMVGGDGNDHMYGMGPKGGTDGADTMSGGAGDDYIQGNAGADLIDGGDGNDRIQGGQDNDVITGGSGNDVINGNLGNDHIDGGIGDDWIRGGKGNDVIVGGAGNDILQGDLGADTMTGGVGVDVFRFSGNDAATISTDTLLGHVDTITDFTAGEDHISLGFAPTAIHDGSASTITDALAWATTALTGHSSDVAAVTVGTDTFLFYSSSNGSVADSVIDLQNVHDLTLTAFA